MKNTKILVTGGSGFIPSHITRRLVQMGANVSVIVKYNSLIDNVRLVDIWDDIQIIEADIRNIDSLSQIKRLKPDIVVHMAAYNHVGDSFIHVNEALESNAIGTANVLETYEDYELFIYTSTSEVYGYQTNVPFVETMQPTPISPYSIGKYSGELYARMKSEEQKRPVVVLRPFNAFGPYQSTRAIIGELIVKCLRGEAIETTAGEQTREFNYVSNLADGFIQAIKKKDDAIGKVINVGSGVDIKIKDLVNLIHELTQSKSELRIGALEYRQTEIWRMYADAELAREILDWKPEINFKEGLVKTIEWYHRYLDTMGKSGALATLTK